eukprot:GHVS01065343.1.p1 GENE.GHVS01065343.1~~GHVS01065343.1.p1  ORF type:complete len:259 (-),score=13.03 GHVS01065343.1:449-1225(-)
MTRPTSTVPRSLLCFLVALCFIQLIRCRQVASAASEESPQSLSLSTIPNVPLSQPSNGAGYVTLYSMPDSGDAEGISSLSNDLLSPEQHDTCMELMATKINDGLTLAYHLHNAPSIFRWLWGISSVVAASCFLLWLKHIISLSRAGHKLRKQQQTVFAPQLFSLYVKIFTFFPLIGVLGWASVFLPRFSLMFSLLLHLYEVACLMWFWQLMVDLLDGPDNAVEILSTHPPRLVWNVPPLCFLSYVMKPRYFCSVRCLA